MSRIFDPISCIISCTRWLSILLPSIHIYAKVEENFAKPVQYACIEPDGTRPGEKIFIRAGGIFTGITQE
jgi:hypothetical protein